MQGASELALTKMDVLSYLEQIPVCVAYDVDGEKIDYFPIGDKLNKAKPVIEYLPGWKCDISGCRTMEELPIEARNYIAAIEKAMGCPITYISVGAKREAIIVL